MIPFQITFRDFPESDFVWLAAQKRIERLEHFFSRIIRCEVVISCPHRHRHADRLYHVQVHVVLPGDIVVVNRNHPQDESHRDVYVAIRDSFNAAERILEDKVRKIRRMVKIHNQNYQQGLVSKIFHNDGYGFLNTNDGREIYFGENCLTNEKFDRLKIGQKVKFLVDSGLNGPQVTTMAVK